MKDMLRKDCSSQRPVLGLQLGVALGAIFITVAAGCSSNEAVSTRGKKYDR